MAKKPKLNFGGGDGHNFFAKHVEKLILVVVALLVVFFVYRGWSIETIDPTQTPVGLKQDAANARSKVQATKWEDVAAEEDRHAEELKQRLATADPELAKTPEAPYANMLAWNTPLFKVKAKRTDPPLLPAEALEVEAGLGPVAMFGNTADDELMKVALEAKQKADEEAKKKASRKKDNVAAGYGYGAEGAGYGSGGPGYGGEAYGSEMMGSEMMGGGYGMMGGSMGYGSTTASGPTATPEQLAAVPGFRPGAGSSSMGSMGSMGMGSMGMGSMGMASGYEGGMVSSGAATYGAESSYSESYGAESGYGGYGGTTAGPGTVAKAKHWVAIKARVPFKDQWNEFQQVFENSHDYNPQRDTPRYFWYQVERVEVDDDGQPLDGTATAIGNPDHPKWYLRNWFNGMMAEEIVDPAYRDPILTAPCPPIMMRELERFQLHSDTPKRKFVVAAPKKKEDPTQKAPPKAEGIGPRAMAGAQSPYGSGAGMGYGMGSAGMGMGSAGMGMGYGSSMEMGYGGSGYGDMGYGTEMTSGSGGYGYEQSDAAAYGSGYGMDSYGAEGYGMQGYGTDSYGAESYGAMGSMGMGYGDMTSGMGYGSGMGMGMGGYGGMGMGGRPLGPTADYKLFRFYDMTDTLEVGKKYKYRVKLYLLDPNHPQDPRMAPAPAYLADDVLSRIKEIDAGDAQASETNGQPTRTYWVETEWSEWSPEVSIPPNYQVLAGVARSERVSQRKVGETTVEIPDPNSEPEASLLTKVFDRKYAADMLGLLTVDVPEKPPAVRGTVLNFQDEANVLHPVSLQVLQVPDYQFQTNVLVLDIRGGQDLPTTDRANINHKSPGEILLMDAAGNLMVRNELDDLLDFNNNVFKEPEKPKTTPTDQMGYGAEGYGAEGYGAEGYGGDPYGGYGEGGGRRSRGGRSSR